MSNLNPSIDLHCHTIFSDGAYSPEVVLHYAAAKGIHTLALTDHDNTNGLRVALPLAAELEIELIAGIELTSRWHQRSPYPDENDIDVLGYFIDLDNSEFHAYEQAARNDYRERIAESCRILTLNGYPLSLEEVLAENANYTGALQLFLAFLHKGYAPNWDLAVDLASSHLHGLRASPFTIAQVIEQIHLAGGVAVLAHPTVVTFRGARLTSQQVGMLVDLGLDGLEIYHHRLDEDARTYFLALAQHYNLVVSGGSDMHGWFKSIDYLGNQPITAEMVTALRQRAEKYR
jgi:predicted metal-dependent phosphoesterase TrpH